MQLDKEVPETLFCVILPILIIFALGWFFQKNPALSRTTPHVALTPYRVSEKIMHQFQQKFRTDERI